MVSSTVLFAFYVSESSIESVSGYGAKMHIGNPDAIVQMAWFAWGYFLLRYIQAFNENGLPIYRLAYDRLLKKRYMEHLSVDMDSISDFGFLDKMIVKIAKKPHAKDGKKCWLLTVKMKDESDAYPFFIHHTSGEISAAQVRKLKSFVRWRAMFLYPHFMEYVFPMIYGAALLAWRVSVLYAHTSA